MASEFFYFSGENGMGTITLLCIEIAGMSVIAAAKNKIGKNIFIAEKMVIIKEVILNFPSLVTVTANRHSFHSIYLKDYC